MWVPYKCTQGLTRLKALFFFEGTYDWFLMLIICLWLCSSVSISLDRSPSVSGCTSPMSPRSPMSPSLPGGHWQSPCQSPSPRGAQSPVQNGHLQEVFQHTHWGYKTQTCVLLLDSWCSVATSLLHADMCSLGLKKQQHPLVIKE